MKSLKKTLVLLVVFSMILSTLVPAFAATDVDGLDCEDQVTRMEALGIIKGFEDGTFRPTETITRAQMAVIICKMTGVTDAIADANKNVDSKFSDVKAGEWYTGYVNIASNNGIITGFPDGTFRPNETLTLNQVLTLCVKALGRGGYVDKMGTWPANYIAEAARLNLLKDVKGASDANRGNVAVICWNTLNTNTWYVSSEKLDGEVTLGVGEETKTLLAINFADFTTTNDTFKEIEDIEITKDNINDRQLKFKAVKDVFADFEDVDTIKSFEFSKKPSKDKDEKSYKDGDTIYVYVPEEVYEDLDELKNKTITLILGEDNVAALILVQDDVTEKDFLTAYDDEKEKITIGETKYDLAKDTDSGYGYTVTLNDRNIVPEASSSPLKTALNLIDKDMDLDEIEKKIEIEVTLDDEDDVKAIDLTASAKINDESQNGLGLVSDEVLVTKVKETNSKYTIYTTGGNVSWEIDDEDDLDFPKVYVDGNKADIRDIEAGNVLTVLLEEKASEIEYNSNDIAKIYVSTEIVTGEASRIKKGNLAITLDDTVYTATGMGVTMSTEELSKYLDDKKSVKGDLNAIVDNDTVTLYLNMFGEYAFVTLDEVASNWTFGVVTYVSSNVTWEGDDEEIAVRNFKLLLDDGTKATYKLKVDTDDEDITSEKIDELVTAEGKIKEYDFVAIKADADKVVTIEDGDEVVIISATTDNKVALKYLDGSAAKSVGDYNIVNVGNTTTNKDDEEFGDYEYASKTVIFNRAEKEIVSKWKSILDTTGESFEDDDTIAIFEDEDEDEALYLVVALGESEYGNEDAIYAIVEESENVGDDNYVKFVGQDEMKAKDIKLLDEGWLVAYKTASSKVSEVQKLINVKKVNDAKDDKTVADYLELITTVACPNAGDKTATSCSCTSFTPYVAAVNAVHGTVTCGKTNADGNTAHISGCSKSAETITADACTGTASCPNSSDKTATSCRSCTLVTSYVAAVDAVHGEISNSKFFTLTTTTTTAPDGTMFVNNINTTTTLEQIVLKEVEVKSSGKSTLKFVETGDEDVAIDSVKLSEDVKVYDLRNGEVNEIDIDDLANEVNEEDEDVYVVAAVNGDYDNDGANVVFIVK